MTDDRRLWGKLNNPDLALDQVQVGVLGIPFDSAASHRRGTAFGPEAIRAASRRYHPLTETCQDLSGLRVRDFGDVAADALDQHDTYADIDRQVGEMAAHGIIPCSLGGDHSVTFPVIRALSKQPPRSHVGGSDRIGILWIDAHPDLMPIYGGHKFSHACPLRRAMELDEVDPTKVVMLGIRKVEPAEWQFMVGERIQTFTAHEMSRHPIQWIAERVKSRLLGVQRLYWSIDIDVLDPACAPGTGVPTPGGLTTRQLFDLIHALSDLPVSGFDLVEVSPPYDQAEITAFAAAATIMEMFGVVASAR